MFKNLHKTGELFTIFEKSYCHVGDYITHERPKSFYKYHQENSMF